MNWQVLVAFSGGRSSSALLHLIHLVIARRQLLPLSLYYGDCTDCQLTQLLPTPRAHMHHLTRAGSDRVKALPSSPHAASRLHRWSDNHSVPTRHCTTTPLHNSTTRHTISPLRTCVLPLCIRGNGWSSSCTTHSHSPSRPRLAPKPVLTALTESPAWGVTAAHSAAMAAHLTAVEARYSLPVGPLALFWKCVLGQCLV